MHCLKRQQDKSEHIVDGNTENDVRNKVEIYNEIMGFRFFLLCIFILTKLFNDFMSIDKTILDIPLLENIKSLRAGSI